MLARQILSDIGACFTARTDFGALDVTKAWDACMRLEQKVWFACKIGARRVEELWEAVGEDPRNYFEDADEDINDPSLLHDAIQEDFTQIQKEVLRILITDIDIEAAVEKYYDRRTRSTRTVGSL